jgi:hypothetical protein
MNRESPLFRAPARHDSNGRLRQPAIESKYPRLRESAWVWYG